MRHLHHYRSHHPYKPYSTGNKVLDGLIKKLIVRSRGSKAYGGQYLEDIVITAIKLIEDRINPADVRLMTIALKELRYAFKVFKPYEYTRKVAIFGSARTSEKAPEFKQAREFGKEISDRGWMVITGAASGIMQAGNEGAGRENSFGVNIYLPFEQDANEVMQNDRKLINFKYFFTRKLIFMRESDATVLFPGGFGTHDEGFETLTLVQTGKTEPRPIVAIDPPGSTYWSGFRKFIQKELAGSKLIDPKDLELIYFTHSVKDAADYVMKFYSNYHSCRYVKNVFVVRMKRKLSAKRLALINRSFKDLLKTGSFKMQMNPFPEEADEPDTHAMARLVFHFTRRHYARLKELIHVVNQE